MATKGKKFIVGSVLPEQRMEHIESVFADMKAKAHGNMKGGLLLAGDPGVGKTSFMKQLAKLMGIKLVVIETPHLVEEHIVNIPFIVYHPENETASSDSIVAHKSKFDVKLADSDLYNQVAHSKIVPDSQALNAISHASSAIRSLHEAIGGTKDSFSEEVQELRQEYKCILFLDEYYRETSMSIRNVLRGILNGRLGLHELPRQVYIAYASNMNDEGIEGISMNQQFSRIDFESPGKDEWFSWLVHTYGEHESIKLNMKIIEKFHSILEDEDISSDDADADVRTSPRRWEQLLLLINNALPVKNQEEAKILMQNVHINFRHYKTGAKANLLEKVSRAVAELIKDISGVEIGKNETHSVTEWRDVLASQVKAKMEIGEARSYVPVISGAPGVGKTSHVLQVALDLGLVPVVIDCANLSPEDSIGLPLSDENSKGDIVVKFSEPMLKKIIDNQIRDGEANLKKMLEKHRLGQKTGAPDAKVDWDAFQKQDHKYLIFFDELNRTSTKVFNALRRVLLDKKFSDDMELPKGSVIIAAINPEDHGTTELTKHMRDVLDIIPVGCSWNQTKNFLHKHSLPSIIEHLKNQELAKAGLMTIEAFMQRFRDPRNLGKTGEDGGETEFHLNAGSSNVYLSPREITDLYSNICYGLDPKLSRFKKFADNSEDNNAINEAAAKMNDEMFKQFKKTLSFVIENKHGTQSPNFFEDLREWFMTSPEAQHLDLVSKKAKVMTLEKVLIDAFKDPKVILAKNNEFVNYLQNVDPATFGSDIRSFFHENVKDLKFVTDKIYVKRDLAPDKKTISNAKVGENQVTKADMITKCEHLVMEIVHAIYINDVSREFIPIIKDAFGDELSKLHDVNDDDDCESTIINSSLGKYIRKLAKYK